VEAGSSTSYDFSVGSVAGWDSTVALTVDVSPSLAGVSLSTNTVMNGDSFTLDVATDSAALWGDYTITVTGDDGAIVKSKAVSLTVLPQGIQDFTYGNDNPVAIPDNDATGISSTIVIADDIQVFGINADVDISHTWIGDLVVTLTSPAGTEVTLHNREGGSADDIVKSWDLSAFNGEMATGTWTLFVNDSVGSDTGTLNSWGLVISGVGDAAPAAPIADFSYEVEGLSVAFTNLSSDMNDDIVSYSWNFGDGAGISTEMNPMYNYAGAGVYTVTLTVTDSEGNVDTSSNDIELFERVVNASVTRAKLSRRGTALVDLSWDNAIGESVVIYRNGEAIATTANDGNYRDRFSTEPSTAFDYVICETDSSLCSSVITAQF
jgi:subtilisin-like proprotein convertase family protein